MTARATAGLLALALAACASSAVDDRAPLGRPTRPSAQVWFAVRAVPCARVVDALARYAGQPGVVAPETARVRESDPWCALAAHERHGVRADSWAQHASLALGAPALSFYVADGAWSFAVFSRGLPIYAMESHYGPPVLVGDLSGGAAALGVRADDLAAYRVSAHRPEAHRELAALVGVDYPSPQYPTVEVRPVPSADAPPPPPPEPPPHAFEVRQWVVMPPHGVMLIKAIEDRPTSEGAQPVPTYVVVAGDRTLAVPMTAARTMGMRPVATRAAADAFLARLREDIDVPDAERYDEQRTRRYLNALTRGDLAAIVDAHRELCELRDTRKLFALENGMLESVRTWLVEELSTAREEQPQQIEAQLREACD